MRTEQLELHNPFMRLSLLSYGASIRSLEVPDRHGMMGSVHLELDSLDQYFDHERNPYLGASVGRYANRISSAGFLLNGRKVALEANEGPHQLHGGPKGFARQEWQVLSHEPSPHGGRVTFALSSPDGDQGFPGNLSVRATYDLVGGTLRITYSATTDAPTVVNLTNHGYWNLDGTPTVSGHALTLGSTQVLPVGGDGIPLSGLQSVHNTPFDFRSRTLIGDALRMRPEGFDHCFSVDGQEKQLRFAALLDAPLSGRWMRVRTDQRAVQLYTGGGLGWPFSKFGAVCLEAQMFPDTPNRSELGSAVLLADQNYQSVTELEFGVGQASERWQE
ncbi:MAG: aldose epimerase family protein [Microthrixaceae bacterium]